MRGLMYGASGIALMVGVFAGPAIAQAQPTTTENQKVEEPAGDIIVTASRRNERSRDVALAISAYRGDQLQALNVSTGADLARVSPGINFTAPTGAGGNIVFNLRGVGLNDFGVGNEGPIAIYVDDVYQASLSSAAAPTFDMERVEVLRGPQGTTFGRNATGGLVHFVSVSPGPDLGGRFDVRGGPDSVYAEGALNLPLTSRIAARASFSAQYLEPNISNALGANGGGGTRWANRLRVTYGGDGTTIDLIGRYSQSHSKPQYTFLATGTGANGLGYPLAASASDIFGVPSSPALARLDDGDPYTGAVNDPGKDDRENYGFTAKITRNLGSFDLVSVTDWTHNTAEFREDSDVSPLKIAGIESNSKAEQFSQEVRLVKSEGGFRWIAGLYYFKNDVSNDRVFNIDIAGAALDSRFKISTESIAAFAEGSVQLGDQLTLVIGARVTHETRRVGFAQDAVIDTNGSGLGSPSNLRLPNFAFGEASDGDLARLSATKTSGRARLEWRPSTGVLFYTAFNRGFKSGGFNNPLDASYMIPARMPYRPERLDSYEVGTKLSLLDRKLDIGVNAFHYDYRDFQAFRTEGLSSFLSNVPAKINGVDFEFDARIARGLIISGGFELLDAKADGVTLPSGIEVSRRLANAPRFSSIIGAHYEADLGSGKVLVDLNGRLVSEQFFDISNAPVTREGGYSTLDARLGYRFGSNGIEVYVAAVNLFDQRYRVYAIDVNSLGFSQSMFAEPRRLTVGLKGRF